MFGADIDKLELFIRQGLQQICRRPVVEAPLALFEIEMEVVPWDAVVASQVVDVYVEGLDLGGLGFAGVEPQATGRPAYHPSVLLKLPAYHPSVLLKLYIYGYLNRVQSSRRLEREAGRNVEVMWLCGRLVPDHKTIADFRKDNGPAIGKVCSQFVALCRQLDLLADAGVAVDGSKFKAVNARDRNFTAAKMARRVAQIEESVERYLHQLDSADRQEPSLARTTKTERLHDKIAKLREEMARLGKLEAARLPKPQTSANRAKGKFVKADFVYVAEDDVYVCPAGERLSYRYTTEEKGLTLHRYWTSVCQSCALKDRCTSGKERRITRWQHEPVLEAVEQRLDENPDAMRVRRETVEHPFGTIKSWMGSTHFQTKTLKRVATEMALHVLAYNLKRVMNILGIGALIAALQAA
jgi:transposase